MRLRVSFLFLMAVVIYAEDVITPFGVRPKDCVIEVPSGSTVIPGDDDNTLIIKTPATETDPESVQYFMVPPHCGGDIENIRQNRIQRRNQESVQVSGWLDYVGWYPPNGENSLSSFTSTYVVPGDPQNNNGGQVLFYFIGMQDNDDTSAINILQPVLTWGNGFTQWYVKSWVCCPKNITVSSPPIFGLSSGSQVHGVIHRETDSTWTIDSVFDGKHTTLNAQVGDYIYNWADITLEVYYVNQCEDFAKGKAYFNDLKMTDAQGQQLSPQWKPTGTTFCSGSIAPGSSNSYYIEHVY